MADKDAVGRRGRRQWVGARWGSAAGGRRRGTAGGGGQGTAASVRGGGEQGAAAGARGRQAHVREEREREGHGCLLGAVASRSLFQKAIFSLSTK